MKSKPQMDPALSELLDHVIKGEVDEAARCLTQNPELATAASEVGATRENAIDFFYTPIDHYLYALDTALHMAAAAFRRPMAELLIAHGANWQARNRHGAQPLHYAADTNHWDPASQVETVDSPISHPSGICALAKRVAWALSSGT